MTKTAATTTRQIAERRVAAFLRASQIADHDGRVAVELVALVFNVLTDPDLFMQEAGRRELALAMPSQLTPGPTNVRNLAAALWRTMLAEARR